MVTGGIGFDRVTLGERVIYGMPTTGLVEGIVTGPAGPPRTGADRSRLEALAVGYLAGPLAAGRFACRPPDWYAGDFDQGRVLEVAQWLTEAPVDTPPIWLELTRLERAANAVLDRPNVWDAIVETAARLLRKGSLSLGEVVDAMYPSPQRSNT
jgi:hypothetical protein